MNNCCKNPVIPLTATVVPGTSVTLANAEITDPTFGQCFNILVSGDLLPITGREEVIITIGGVTAPLVDNCGKYVVSQMLRCRRVNDCNAENPIYRIQYGVQGAEAVFFARRGFRNRRAFLDVVTPPTP